MDIRQLRYFIAIAELGSFSRAAIHLHIAQPALSLHIRNMEAQLGTALLFRNAKGVLLTEAGEILLREAHIILEQLASTEKEIRNHNSDPCGEVRIGLPGTISQTLAVPLVLAARKRYPKIKLCIAEAMSGFVLEWLQTAHIDLAILYCAIKSSNIAMFKLLEEELLFFGSATHLEEGNDKQTARSYRDIVQMPLILPSEVHGLREFLEKETLAMGMELHPILEVDSYINIKKLVATGLGYSILPANAIAAEVANSELVSWCIKKPDLKRSIYLAHACERPLSVAASAIKKSTAGSITRAYSRRLMDWHPIIFKRFLKT